MTQQRTFPENVTSPTSQREELAAVIESGYGDDPTDCPYDHAPAIADSILAAGYSKPRTITTAEELDALTDGAVVIDDSGDVSQLRGGFWCSYETGPMTNHRLAKYLPATVIHEARS
jgi:hypothetical protein